MYMLIVTLTGPGMSILKGQLTILNPIQKNVHSMTKLIMH